MSDNPFNLFESDPKIKVVKIEYLINAHTKEQATYYARCHNLKKWRYISNPYLFLGLSNCMVITLPGHELNRNYHEIREHIDRGVAYGSYKEVIISNENDERQIDPQALRREALALRGEK